jgi:hypothetical protein
MNTTYFYVGAAIGKTGTTGNTFSAIEIRDEGNSLAYFKTGDTVKLDQLTCQLMT